MMSLELTGASALQAQVDCEGEHLHVPDAEIRTRFCTAGDHQIETSLMNFAREPQDCGNCCLSVAALHSVSAHTML